MCFKVTLSCRLFIFTSRHVSSAVQTLRIGCLRNTCLLPSKYFIFSHGLYCITSPMEWRSVVCWLMVCEPVRGVHIGHMQSLAKEKTG